MVMQHSQSEPNIIIKDPKMKHVTGKWRECQPNYRFRNSQMKTCKGFLTKAGSMFAIPHRTGVRPPPPATTATPLSEYGQEFQEKRFCYCSMPDKPLEPYNMHAYRSRNAVDEIKMARKDSSSVSFDQGLHVCKARQFRTNSMNTMKGLPVDPRTNPEILADEKRKHEFFKNL